MITVEENIKYTKRGLLFLFVEAEQLVVLLKFFVHC
jgi:hypothetical protein